MVNEKTERLLKKIEEDAASSGYNLNADRNFTKSLVNGLIVNEERYGYQACPCRLASGDMQEDLDIICPCDYRDPDLDQYGACYCALYVDKDILSGKKKVKAIPDRRNDARQKKQPGKISQGLAYPVWRCRVCGYLCARDNPPAVCPICKAKKERFEVFLEK
jgi:ferredoxin-thioredoxin reductase catalytic subunit